MRWGHVEKAMRGRKHPATFALVALHRLLGRGTEALNLFILAAAFSTSSQPGGLLSESSTAEAFFWPLIGGLSLEEASLAVDSRWRTIILMNSPKLLGLCLPHSGGALLCGFLTAASSPQLGVNYFLF